MTQKVCSQGEISKHVRGGNGVIIESLLQITCSIKKWPVKKKVNKGEISICKGEGEIQFYM